MIVYPNIDTEVWREKYGIKIDTYNCPNCSGTYQTTVPISFKGYAGLESPIHGCGKAFTGIVVVPTSRKEIGIWKQIQEHFFG